MTKNIKLGVYSNNLKIGKYVLIEKAKFIIFLKTIKEKSPDKYNKLIEFLNTTELVVEENI